MSDPIRSIASAAVLAGVFALVGMQFAKVNAALTPKAHSAPKPPPLAATSAAAPSFTPAPDVSCTPHYEKVELFAGRDKHFHPDVEVNGARLKMLVDTGATFVSLTAEDAKKAGVGPEGGKRVSLRTANGVISATKKPLKRVTVDRLTLCDVEAVLLPPSPGLGGAGGRSLLGLSFLGRIAGYSVHNERLILNP